MGIQKEQSADSATEEVHDVLELAGQVFDGLSEEEIREVERITLERHNDFQSLTKSSA